MESSSDWTKSPRLDLAPFSSDATFPKNSPGQIDLSTQYRKLWDQFLKTWRNNQAQTPLDYVNASCAILSHFTWCIPSAVNARPDISLYDHLLTTAALALAQAWADDGSKPFLLLGGNLNGLQKYILKINAGQGGLARRLRARSFQIAVYIESVMLEILRRLSLPLTQCLSLAGGKFQLLLPNSQEARDVIKDVLSKATDWLYKQSGAELSLNLAYISSDAKEMRDDFISLSQRVLKLLRQERNREGSSILQNEQGWVTDKFVLSAVMPAPGVGLCQGCGQRPKTEESLCEVCKAEAKLGKELTLAEKVTFFSNESQGDYPSPLGSFSLLDNKSVSGKSEVVAYLTSLPTYEKMTQPLVLRPRAKHVPEEEHQPLEFSQIAQRSKGQPSLGYLKLDVDRLGFVFSNGFGEDRSISRTAALSRVLEVFFSLHVERLCKEFGIYIVYSGGDDVAAIGPWDKVFDFALKLRTDFQTYCSNPNFTLSAGLAVVSAKQPVTDALEEAERLLLVSKTIPGQGKLPLFYESLAKEANVGKEVSIPKEASKDRITAFSTSLPWDDYVSTLSEAKQLLNWLENKVVTSSQVHRLLRYAQMFENFQKTGNTLFFEYAPLLSRDISRNWKTPDSLKGEAKKWVSSLAIPGNPHMAGLGFVCRYALTGNRKFENC
jgi:CRISPR-associated protein Csm1